jgi:hypothetical protein
MIPYATVSECVSRGRRNPERFLVNTCALWLNIVAGIEIIALRNSFLNTVIRTFIDVIQYFFLTSLGGMRLSPCYAGHCWPIAPAPDDRWWWLWSGWWNEDWQGKPKYSEKTCPSVTLSTTNPTWPDLGSNSGLRSGKPWLTAWAMARP